MSTIKCRRSSHCNWERIGQPALRAQLFRRPWIFLDFSSDFQRLLCWPVHKTAPHTFCLVLPTRVEVVLNEAERRSDIPAPEKYCFVWLCPSCANDYDITRSAIHVTMLRVQFGSVLLPL